MPYSDKKKKVMLSPKEVILSSKDTLSTPHQDKFLKNSKANDK